FNVKDLKVKLRLLEEGREHDCDMKGQVNTSIWSAGAFRAKVKNKFARETFTIGEQSANSLRKGFTKFTKGIPKEFSFSFPLNIAMVPSFHTERSQADWLIEAKLEKGFGRDQSLKAVFQVLSI
ncbi:MAG: hypothetical protein O6762_02725, partial [Thaumarchaeota archaeon]|nr:hypothetical protein [Nitrososphaerota archaeon]